MIRLIALGFCLLIAGRTAWSDGICTSAYSFDQGDGVNPAGGLALGVDGNVYGTTQNGGVNGSGAIYKYGNSEATIYSFSALSATLTNQDGANPAGTLVAGPSSSLYGTTQNGGAKGSGTIFKVSTTGALTTLYTFTALSSSLTNTDGANPQTGLTLGADGNLYGTTQFGGANGNGTVFQITPAGKFTRLYTFSALDANLNSTDGATPSGLVQAKGGLLYGTTQTGGANGEGTIFQITTKGVFTTLYSFGNGANDGYSATVGLVIGSDGNLYGTTAAGGANSAGTVFQVTPKGTFTTLYSFGSSNTDGAGPTSGLVALPDGNLYGVTPGGGTNNNGTLFRVTTSGTLSILYSFSAFRTTGDGYENNDGASPTGLLSGNFGTSFNGYLWGATQLGGASGSGTIFQVNLAPVLSAFYPMSGKVGAHITLYGANFTGTTGVSFGKLTAQFSVVSSTQLSVTVPSGAATSTITVKTKLGKVTSGLSFIVTH
jgi:uncharacterized repeat protein (TIGR03803 family)